MAVLGASTTQLFMNLSYALEIPSGSEIILSKMEHETNVKPWLNLAKRLNLTVKWWESPKPELKLTPENLKPLLSEKTKFVACTHTSNILGTIHDVKAIAAAVHSVGALLCVDGVSFAPHRQVDVKAFGVDFYAFSWYKVGSLSHIMLFAKLHLGVRSPCSGVVREFSSTRAHCIQEPLFQPLEDTRGQTRVCRL
jgi:selenocysteine lyase/cysteine desulfurase